MLQCEYCALLRKLVAGAVESATVLMCRVRSK